MQNKKLIILFTLILFLPVIVLGQKQVNSPYSRFNIGMLEPAGSFKSLGMGGVSMGLRDNTSVFFANPASYSSLDTTSFIFDFGFDYSINRISAGDVNYQSDDMNFDHFIFGFPISKKIGFSAGVVPVSNGYYNISEAVQSSGNVEGYTSTHRGNGGLSNFFTGAGIRLNKYLSAGVNMSIMFGELTRSNNFIFEDFENNYHNISSEEMQVSGINFDYGLQFIMPVKKGRFFNAGISMTSGKHYNFNYEQYTYRYTSYGTVDTITYVSTNDNKLFIPGTLRGGVAFGVKDKLTVGIDYITTNWSKAIMPGASGSFADNSSVLFGIEFIPNKLSNLNTLERIEYRAGGHFGNSYVAINGEQLKESGVSAGFGIPLRRSLSKINIYFDYTKRYGGKSSSLHDENFFTMGASLNFYDIWFLQRKYE